jgi:hypothetical protein
MRKKRNMGRAMLGAIAVVALSAVAFTSSASAFSGEWARFNNCPTSNTEVFKCIQSITNGGKVVLGKKNVPIVNPVTLQGGFKEAVENEKEERFSQFVGASNGVTLSKTPQPVPGGLLGIVPPELSPPIVKAAFAFFFENGLTGVNSTLELARPASEITISQNNLAFEEGVALTLPVKVHLENPALGSNCYVGSSSNPIRWNLTTGNTTPPAGTAPIHGKGGVLTFLEEAQILRLTGSELVDNGWSAPGATGCGGFLIELLVNPIINSTIGLPSAAGKNVAALASTNSNIALRTEVLKHP